MNISVDISYYPLKEQFEQDIWDFIHAVKSTAQLEVITNGMSTQIFGDAAVLFPALNTAMLNCLTNDRGIFVLKIGKGTLKLA